MGKRIKVGQNRQGSWGILSHSDRGTFGNNQKKFVTLKLFKGKGGKKKAKAVLARYKRRYV